MIAEIIYHGWLDIQVCVPEDWTDDQVLKFAAKENIDSAGNDWVIRREGDMALADDPERAPCEDKGGYSHLMLDAVGKVN